MYSRLSAVGDLESLLLPGVPFDYLNTPIYDGGLRQLVASRDVLEYLMRDNNPLPTTEAREGYFGPRHLEYWLSGYRDAKYAVEAAAIQKGERIRVLDFGGASGRVIRHIPAWCPGAELFLSDINVQHVGLVQSMFKGQVLALRNRGIPSLPFPDGYLDLVIAFSVFTHIDSEDTAWLLELRRVLKPGGTLYFTIHDEATWDYLPRLASWGGALAAPELTALRERQPELEEKITHFYSASEDYNCNVFVPASYVNTVWSPLFASTQIHPLRHDHQTGVTCRVRA